MEEKISRRVIGAAIEVHRHLGPGLLEGIYKTCLAHELALAGLIVAREVPLPVDYKDMRLECGYRLDLVVEQTLIVEIKSVGALLPLHGKQLLTYLRLSGLKAGLLLNFNTMLLKDGIERVVA